MNKSQYRALQTESAAAIAADLAMAIPEAGWKFCPSRTGSGRITCWLECVWCASARRYVSIPGYGRFINA